MINLSAYELTDAEIQLLSHGLTFCPGANFDLFEAITDIQLFAQKILLKSFYAKNESEVDTTDWSELSMKEFKALWDLTLLFQENNTIDLINQIDLHRILEESDTTATNPTLAFKKSSYKFPPSNSNLNVSFFLKQMIRDLYKLPLNKNKH